LTKPFIKLERLIQEKHGLSFHFDTSLSIFHRKSFFIDYDDPSSPGDFRPAPDPIAVIPFAAVMSPIAWASGAEIILPQLDAEYAMALERCRHYYKKWFHKWAFGGALRTSLVRRHYKPERHAMLFSSGLDSLATYIAHREKDPMLFTVFGADIPLSYQHFISLCKERFDQFAKNEKRDIRYISTDVRDILNLQKLKPLAGNWWGEVAHGLTLSSLIAPLVYDQVKTLLIASCSHRPGCQYPCGSQKELIEEVRWADTGILNDNSAMNRSAKIRAFLAPNPQYNRYLRVCWMQFESFNCGKCEKCLRTICELLINNVDPATCNFHINHETLPTLKKKILYQYDLFFHGESALDFWREIQDSVRLDEIQDMYGSKAFFHWFVQFTKLQKRQNSFAMNTCALLMDMKTQAGKQLRAAKSWLRGVKNTAWQRASLGKVQV
jgi:hypothetical protein